MAHRVVRTLLRRAASGRNRHKRYLSGPGVRRGRALSRGQATARPSPQAVSAHSGHESADGCQQDAAIVEQATSVPRGFEEDWCPGEDSNLHGFHHWYLKPARLPIPPPGLSGRLRKAAQFGLSNRAAEPALSDPWRPARFRAYTGESRSCIARRARSSGEAEGYKSSKA
jgi:hypothetical protein